MVAYRSPKPLIAVRVCKGVPNLKNENYEKRIRHVLVNLIQNEKQRRKSKTHENRMELLFYLFKEMWKLVLRLFTV
jgi:hypothetical protein